MEIVRRIEIGGLGERIHQACRAHPESNLSIAQKIGFSSRSSLSRYFNGDIPIEESTLLALESVLGEKLWYGSVYEPKGDLN